MESIIDKRSEIIFQKIGKKLKKTATRLGTFEQKQEGLVINQMKNKGFYLYFC